MRRLVYLALLLSSLFTAAIAQKPESPPSTKPADKPADRSSEKRKDYSQEAFVIEQVRTRLRFESDGTGRKETTARVRVQSEAGVEQWGQVLLGYNSANERVEIPYVRVLKKDGSVVTTPADSVQDLSAPVAREAPVYTDYRQKHITVPGLRQGEVLEYDMATIIHTPLAPGQFWTEYGFDRTNINLDEQLEVNVPGDRPLKLKTKPGFDPKISEENGRRVYRWTSSHLEREDDDKDKDKDKKKRKKKKPEDEVPAVQLTTFNSWEEIGRWYAGLDHDRRQPTPEIRAKADELTKGLGGDLDRVEALYDYVAKNFRYVSLSLGLGRYQPHAGSRDSVTFAIRSCHHFAADGQRRSLDGQHHRSRAFPSAFLQHPKKTGAGDSVRRRPAPARDAGRPADGQLASANHRRYDQRTGQAQREGELRGARRYRTLDAHHFPARAQCAVATFGREHQFDGRPGWRDHEPQSGRSGGHAGALPIFLRCLQGKLPRLVEEEIRPRIAACPVQPGRCRRRRNELRLGAHQVRTSGGVYLSREVGPSREGHRARAPSIFPEA